MKKIFTFFLVLAASMGIVYASGTQVDGIWYDFDSSTKTASVTYPGDDASHYEKKYTGNVVIPSSVTYNGITYSVTSIGINAFYDCSSLTSVTIPNSVTSIGSYAFYDCSSLTSVTIPNSVTRIGYEAFYDCSSLTSVTISATSIGSSAFSYCSSLTSVTIGESVTSIGEDAFQDCYSLTKTNYTGDIAGWCNIEFGNSDANPIPRSHNFYINDQEIKDLVIPNNVTSIGSYAFYGCSSLTSVTIPNSVTSIGDYAFEGCSSLTSPLYNAHCFAYMPTSYSGAYTIPEGIEQIAGGAFGNCSSLTSIIIPNSVTKVGGGIYYGCFLLESIVLSENITSLPHWQEKWYYYGFFDQCKSLTSITIPNSVTSIGEDAFQGCSSLTKTNYTGDIAGWCNIEFGSSDANPIHQSHNFYINDQEIKDLVVPNSVTSIRPRTFSNCSSFTSVTIPNSVTSIGYKAFNGCNKLYHIYCYAPEPPVIEEDVFTNYNVNLYVPCNYLDNYKYDRVFGSFRYIQCIDSEDVTTNDVVVTPGTNDVTITWPTEGNADTYTIVIKKGNDVFCTLTFNKDGQLLNIAFAPGRDGNHPAQYAEQTTSGYRFTVTNLESGTKYGYNIEVKDASNKTIKSHSGEFTTQSTTAVDNITTNNANIQKIMRDGQFIIVRDGVEYNAVGQEL